MSMIEARTCRCGSDMEPKSTQYGAFCACLNCDRKPSKQDSALTKTYQKTVDKLSRGWYPKWADAGSPKTMKEANKKKEEGK